MRVLIIANKGLGLYKFRRELLEELVKENEVFFCIPEDEFVDEIESIGCVFVPNVYLDRHGANPIQDLKLLHFYKGVIKEIAPDIVFSYTIKPNVYGGMACAKARVPYVVNVTGLGTAIENGGAMQKLCLALYKIGIRKAQKVFFQNAENQDFMVRHGLVKGEYELIPGSGVNLKQYKVLPYPTSSTVDFVFVARVMKEKGIDQYLDAAEVIRERHPETRFHVCGFCEQEYEETLKEFARRGIVIYHGLVPDMTEIYKIASCTVHPTYYPEGLSNVLLESAASGRPIIATNRSGCREIIDDKINGYVVNQKDSEDLIAKIEKFLSLTIEERMAMGLAGRTKVENEFDRSVVVKKYLNEVERARR